MRLSEEPLTLWILKVTSLAWPARHSVNDVHPMKPPSVGNC
jgi:hypothetical protein